MPQLYIIAGCNGAGKTTASYTLLPEMLDCKEFVNADVIAAEISPGNPESVAFEAGRKMLQKIHQLINERSDFAFETTLATRSYASLIKNATAKGYEIILLYYWLKSPEFAKKRVAARVAEGGHNIPADVIKRRYYRGINNLINLYIPICHHWIVIDNMNILAEEIIVGSFNNVKMVIKSTFGILFWSKADIMSNKEKELMEFSDKVMQSMKKAMRKLVEASAVQNKKLIVGDKDGNPISVPAKELLKKLQ
ncbi:zeta toxin family protein [Chitinophaga sp.]|uniref:zeta toxin family protein n=1 Tax=Chitinophaga sp. TaxID=1869181 RepID=UPI0025B87362|nr:zeta toxin family protein [Chitinophaga sp.]